MSAPKHRAAQPRHILATQVAHLRAEGLSGLKIAVRLGISTSYAYELINDPSGEWNKTRKEQYAGTCVDCGGRTFNAGSKPPDRCIPCALDEKTIWTPDAILCAIQEWADEHGGVPPSVGDWLGPADIRGPYPSVAHVRTRFGAWNTAIRAAGFEPHHSGPVGGFTALTLAQRDECAQRYAAGESSTAIAADLGCRYNIVLKWARRAGVPIRASGVRSAA